MQNIETDRHVPYVAMVVDDSEDDAFFLVREMKVQGRLRSAVTFYSGREALKFLRREGCYRDEASFPSPDLLVLDLKMPGVDGFGLLEHIYEHLPHREFKVTVLTSSEAPEDFERCRALGVDHFEVKPPHVTGYADVVRRLRRLVGAQERTLPEVQEIEAAFVPAIPA